MSQTAAQILTDLSTFGIPVFFTPASFSETLKLKMGATKIKLNKCAALSVEQAFTTL